MKCVILQPSYIPWRGYFHQIARADTFIFLDDVQYDRRGWRNRNRIKSAAGPQWLTIPVHSRGAQVQKTPIHEVPIVWETSWQNDHIMSIYHAYKQAPHFEKFYPFLQDLLSEKYALLADFTIATTIAIAGFLGIENKRFLRSSAFDVEGVKTERLINLLKAVGADHYISGPSAQDYIDSDIFMQNQIKLEYMVYDYPEYPQLYPPFTDHLSVIDLIFNTGRNATDYFLE